MRFPKILGRRPVRLLLVKSTLISFCIDSLVQWGWNQISDWLTSQAPLDSLGVLFAMVFHQRVDSPEALGVEGLARMMLKRVERGLLSDCRVVGYS